MSLHVYQGGVEIVSQAFIEGLVIEESADRGTIEEWGVPFDDPAGTLTLTAHYPIQIIESASLYGSQVAYGFLTPRVISRSPTSLTSNARAWSPNIVGLNAYLGFKGIRTGTFHHARPAETDLDRIHWLLSSASGLTPFLHDNGLVATTGGVNMSANDYAGQFPVDVLNDCAQQSGRTFFVYWDQTKSQASLFYNKAAAAVNTAPISVSNYPGEANNSTVFPPDGNAELRLDPSHLYSGVIGMFSGGSVYSTVSGRTVTREVIVPMPDVTSRTVAQARADRYLADYQSEEATLTFTIRVPNTHINAIVAGQRVFCRFSHLPAYAAGAYARVVHRTIKPAAGTNLTSFDLTIECNDPIIVGIGSAPVNSTVWPSAQPPFQPSGGGTFTFVDAAHSPADTPLGPPVATFPGTVAAQDLLVATILMDSVSGTPDLTVLVAQFPTGWVTDVGPVGVPASDNRLQAMWIGHRIADAGESSTVSVTIHNTSTLSNNGGYIAIARYTTGGGTPAVGSTDTGTYSGPSNNASLAALTPTSAQAALIVEAVGHEPNYTSTYSAGWNNRAEVTSGGNRQAIALVDQIITSATGSAYTGTATVAGIGESNWYIPAVVFTASGGAPNLDQPVAPESATGDGSKVIYHTAYPYVPGSLVVKVNGNVVTVAETDPPNGTFTLPSPPAVGAIITWTYNVADTNPTGASNGTPGVSGPAVPPSDGTVLGGDGIYRQPQKAYVPNETPDGSRTVFTIVPYIAGTTIVYLDGLIQRPTTDYSESSPGTGAVTFTSAPLSTDNVVIVASPYLAAPVPSTTRSVTWAAPVTTATYTITGGQFASTPTDISAALNAYLLSVPDGSTIQFPVAADYTLSQGIQLSNRHNLILDGRGTTLRVQAGASGASQLASSIITGHAYGGSFSLGATDIQIHDFVLVGNNPTPGVFTPGTEAQANLEMTGCTRLEVYNITGSGAWGDFIFVEDIIDGWFHACTGTNSGRNGVSVISGTRVLVESSTFTTNGYNMFDIEPNNSSQACTNITIRNNTGATWGNAFLGVEGSHTGAPIHGAVISGNTITGKSLLTIVDNGNTSRMTNIAFTNNTSSAGSVAGPVLKFSHVDNVTVTGNTQVHTGALYQLIDCTNAVTT